jgi:F-type H+-transporting ATPase subunit beta
MSNNEGKIVSIRGIVIDMSFAGEVPKIYDAVHVEEPNSTGTHIVIEIQQQLEDGIVRGVAMDSTDGLSRGTKVTNTGAPIAVPVGDVVLGRMFNVLGEPIDEGKEIAANVDHNPIHRNAPDFEHLSNKAEIFETGIKIVDLVSPILKGGKV